MKYITDIAECGKIMPGTILVYVIETVYIHRIEYVTSVLTRDVLYNEELCLSFDYRCVHFTHDGRHSAHKTSLTSITLTNNRILAIEATGDFLNELPVHLVIQNPDIVRGVLMAQMEHILIPEMTHLSYKGAVNAHYNLS